MAITNSRTYRWSPQASDSYTDVSEDDATANGSTAVTVANTAVTATSRIVFTLKTVGGTPGGAPYVFSKTAGTGFSFKATAGDTSVYHYQVLNP